VDRLPALGDSGRRKKKLKGRTKQTEEEKKPRRSASAASDKEELEGSWQLEVRKERGGRERKSP